MINVNLREKMRAKTMQVFDPRAALEDLETGTPNTDVWRCARCVQQLRGLQKQKEAAVKLSAVIAQSLSGSIAPQASNTFAIRKHTIVLPSTPTTVQYESAFPSATAENGANRTNKASGASGASGDGKDAKSDDRGDLRARAESFVDRASKSDSSTVVDTANVKATAMCRWIEYGKPCPMCGQTAGLKRRDEPLRDHLRKLKLQSAFVETACKRTMFCASASPMGKGLSVRWHLDLANPVDTMPTCVHCKQSFAGAIQCTAVVSMQGYSTLFI